MASWWFIPDDDLYSYKKYDSAFGILQCVDGNSIHDGKEKPNLLLTGHLSHLEVYNLRGTGEQSDESRS